MSTPIYHRTCPHCQVIVYYTSVSHRNKAIRKNAKCRNCLPARRHPPAIEHPCAYCQKLTTNPKYCSRSCTATINGQLYPKRKKKETYCKDCGLITWKKSIRCLSCHTSHRMTITSETTLAEYYNRPSVVGKHPSWRTALIRQLARTLYKNLLTKACQNCGYDKHSELAHIKAISAFSLDSKLKDVNARSNILVLCPNCHWEFDHKLLFLVVGATGLEPAFSSKLLCHV